MLARFILLVTAVVFLSACSSRGGGYYQDDGPHAKVPVELSRVKNAVPRSEPLSASGNNPYVVFGRRYVPMKSSRGYQKTGTASWYGRKFHGRRTSSGEKYDMYAMTAAHTTLPLPSYVKIENLDNHRQVIVRVNDRGPFLHKRLIDLSYAAAHKLGVIKTGTARVRVTAVGPGATASENSGVTIAPVKSDTAAQAEPLEQSIKRTTDNVTTERGVYIQVGSFSIWDNAIKLRDQLENLNIRPVSIRTARVNSVRYFRVRVGPVENLGKAEHVSNQVKKLGIHDSRVIIE